MQEGLANPFKKKKGFMQTLHVYSAYTLINFNVTMTFFSEMSQKVIKMKFKIRLSDLLK